MTRCHLSSPHRLRRLLTSGLVALLAGGAILNGPIAHAVASGVTLTATPSSASTGEQIELKASMPVANPGTISQTIRQEFDPARVKLTSAGDIVAPAGWSLAYSTDGSAFTPSAPTTSAGWASIRAVEATGNVVSDGADANGYQIATNTAQGATVSSTPASLTSTGSGDGYDAFFDVGHTRVFNVNHHGGPAGVVDCHVIATGSPCSGFPLSLKTMTSQESTGRIVGTRLWVPGTRATPNNQFGFNCWDLSAVLASGGQPVLCPGTDGFVVLGSNLPANTVTGGGYAQYDLFEAQPVGASYAGSNAETRLFSYVITSKTLFCLDTARQAPCADMPAGGWPLPFPWQPGDPQFDGDMELWDGRIYIKALRDDIKTQAVLLCVLASNPSQPCAGFTSPKLISETIDGVTYNPANALFVLRPDATGAVTAICLTGDTGGPRCWDATGAVSPGPSWIPTYSGKVSTTLGTRVYIGGGSQLWCWDTAANGGAGGGCLNTAGTPTAGPVSNLAIGYTAQPDPVVPDCVWVVQDPQPTIYTVDTTVNKKGSCLTKAFTVSFAGTALVPRMGCLTGSDATAVRYWRNFLLQQPTTGYTSALLTVRSSTGEAIPGWFNRSVTAGQPVDLTSLPIALTGQQPAFEVTLLGATTSPGPATAQIQAVGDAPELCLTPTVIGSCPTIGPIDPALLVGTTTSPIATGSSNPGGSVGSATTTITMSAPSSAQCGSELRGRAGDHTVNIGQGSPAMGVTVTLLDGLTGAPVLDARGNPITTVTDANGEYSFGPVATGSYKVSFANAQSGSALKAATISGDTGSDTAAKAASGGTATSGLVVVDVGVPGVVNAQYSIVAGARPDTSIGVQGAAQKLRLTSNDFPSTGKLISWTTVRLCDPNATPPELPKPSGSGCTKSSLTIPGEGTYTVDTATTGDVTFTPLPTFSGEATPVTYQFSDNGSPAAYASSTYTPTVIPAPILANDTSSGAWNTAQAITPLANDSADADYPLQLATMGICAGSTTAVTSCTGTANVSTADGTYALDRTTGTVTFTPKATFAGVVTAPIKYSIADSLGQRVMATITPQVAVPPSPSATDETKTVAKGASVAFTTLTGAGGLGSPAPGGPALLQTNTTTGTGLCPVGTVLPGGVATCTLTSLTVTGEGTYTLNRTTGVVTYAAQSSASTGSKTAVTYVVRDDVTGGGRVNWASGVLTPVIPGPPVVVSDVSSGALNTAQTITPLANDSPFTGTTLTPSSVRICLGSVTTASSCASTTLNVAGQGTYTANADGTVTFTPCQATGTSGASCTGPFAGTATAIKYVVTDTAGQLSPLATITPSVTAPAADVANPDTSTGLVNATQTKDPLANDTAPAGVTLTPTTVRLCGTVSVPAPCGTSSVTVAGQGTYSVNTTTGVISFVPVSGFTGTATAVTYQVSDNLSTPRTVSSTYTPTVVGPPSAVADASTGAFGAMQVITPLSNDSSSLGAALDPSTVRLCAAGTASGSCTGSSYVSAGKGMFTAKSDGTVSFAPCTDSGVPDASCTAAFFGAVPAMMYKVADTLGQVTSSTIAVTVAAPPVDVANPDTSTGLVNATQTKDPLANDTAPAGVTLTPTTVRLCGTVSVPAPCGTSSVTVAGQGTYSVNTTTGVISFVPVSGFTGTATAVTYQVSDNLSTPRTVSSTYTPTVVGPPSAANDTSSGLFREPQVIDVLGNDGADGATVLVPSSVKLCGPDVAGHERPPACTADSLVVPGEGTYTVNADGTITFTPASSFTGSPRGPPPVYQVSDALGQVVSAVITPTVAPPAPPTAAPGTATVKALGTVAFPPVLGAGGLATAGSAPLAGVFLCQVDDPATGISEAQTAPNCTAISVATADGNWTIDSATGIATYTNTVGTGGSRTAVAYQVNDAFGLQASSTLTPTVTPPPTAGSDGSIGAAGADQAIAPLGNDSPSASTSPLDPSTLRLCLAGEAAPACSGTANVPAMSGGQQVGIFGVNPDGTVLFRPSSASWSGTVDAIGYQVADTTGQAASASITVVVEPQPAVTAVNDAATRAFGTPVHFSPLSNDAGGSAPSPLTVSDVTSVDGLTRTVVTRTWESIGLNAATMRLCGPGESVPNCTQSAVSTSDGTYTIDGTGSVAFTGCAASGSPSQTPACAKPFTGSATQPIAYQVANRFQVVETTVVTTTDPAVGSTTGFTPVNDAAGLKPTDVGYVPTWTSSTITTTAGSPRIGSATITPTITVTPASPTNDAAVTLVNHPVTLTPLSNDTAGSFPLTTSTLRLCAAGQASPNCSATSVTVSGVGTFVVDPVTGKTVFTPDSGFTGTASVPYQVADTQGGVTSATITVTVNAPTAGNDSSYGLAGNVQAINPLANDAPAVGAGTTLVSGSVRLCDPATNPGQVPPLCTATTLTTADGTYSVNTTTGAVSFTPAPAFISGAATVPVRYQVSDSHGEVATAVITPNVIAPPTPSAPNDSGYAPDGSSVLLPAPGNDTAGNSATPAGSDIEFTQVTLVPGSVRLCASGQTAPGCSATTLTTSEGTYTVDTSTGEVTFAPVAGFTGTARYSVTYQISNVYSVTDHGVTTNNLSQTATATLTPTIVPAPTATAADDNASAPYGQSVTFTPWANDTMAPTSTTGTVSFTNTGAANGFDAASVRLCAAGEIARPGGGGCAATSITTVDGSYVVNADGTVSFTPVAGFSGTVTVPVAYEIASPYTVGNTVPSTSTSSVAYTGARLIATIAPLTAPVAQPDSASGMQGDPVIAVLPTNDANASVAASSTYPIDPASVRLCAASDTAPACTVTAAGSVVVPGKGTFAITNAATGEVTFTPEPGFVGTTSVDYAIADTHGNLVHSTYTVTMTAPQAASAVDDAASTPHATAVTVAVLVNDVAGTRPIDTASVLLCGPGDVAPACTLVELDDATGRYTANPDGTITFTPTAEFTGVASVRYSVADASGIHSSAVLSVTVSAAVPAIPTDPQAPVDPVTPSRPAGPPTGSPARTTDEMQAGAPAFADATGVVAIDDAGTSRVGAPVWGSLASNDMVPAGSVFALASPPAHGTVIVGGDGWYAYVPEPNFVGDDAFSYQVCTPNGLCATAVVHLTVAPASVGGIIADPLAKPLRFGTMAPALFTPQTHGAVARVEIARLGTTVWSGRVVVRGKGIWTLRGTKVVFTPFKGFTGRSTIRYKVVDAGGSIAYSTFTAQAVKMPRVINAGR